ncbi:hypothetical protein GBF38_016853 [Nibea albiflora]|uniref:Uncharacterized protein n=1 Tax=Nibea albiflora TaxID=240163 RepID=A0ACB7EF18_NIBAL|nr:hypothetical protein GBF38_016853 [Nibea albiflora]
MEDKPLASFREKPEPRGPSFAGGRLRQDGAPPKSSGLPWDRKDSLTKVESVTASKNITTDTGAVKEVERSHEVEEAVEAQEVEEDEGRRAFGIKLRSTSHSIKFRPDASSNLNSKPPASEEPCDKQKRQETKTMRATRVKNCQQTSLVQHPPLETCDSQVEVKKARTEAQTSGESTAKTTPLNAKTTQPEGRPGIKPAGVLTLIQSDCQYLCVQNMTQRFLLSESGPTKIPDRPREDKWMRKNVPSSSLPSSSFAHDAVGFAVHKTSVIGRGCEHEQHRHHEFSEQRYDGSGASTGLTTEDPATCDLIVAQLTATQWAKVTSGSVDQETKEAITGMCVDLVNALCKLVYEEFENRLSQSKRKTAESPEVIMRRKSRESGPTKIPDRPREDKWMRKNVPSSSLPSSSSPTMPSALQSMSESSQPSWMELAKRKSMAWSDKSMD